MLKRRLSARRSGIRDSPSISARHFGIPQLIIQKKGSVVFTIFFPGNNFAWLVDCGTRMAFYSVRIKPITQTIHLFRVGKIDGQIKEISFSFVKAEPTMRKRGTLNSISYRRTVDFCCPVNIICAPSAIVEFPVPGADFQVK